MRLHFHEPFRSYLRAKVLLSSLVWLRFLFLAADVHFIGSTAACAQDKSVSSACRDLLRMEAGASNANSALKLIISSERKTLVPTPSGAIDGCSLFYNHPEISRYLTEAFRKNAVAACSTTSPDLPYRRVREELQKLYTTRKPMNGRVFTHLEHKEIHDAAYLAAGCAKGSAPLVLWFVVDISEWPSAAISYGIKAFGQCSVK